MRRNRLLLIDMGYLQYFQEFYKAAQKYMDVYVVTKTDIKDSGNFYKYFYPITLRINDSKLGRVDRWLKGIEYVVSYLRIIMLVKKEHFDIIHIHWAIMPTIDKFFFRKLKKYTRQLVYTAHDVIPHSGDRNLIKSFGELYKIPDKLIVHGEFCRQEVKEFFPEVEDKVYVQFHGTYPKESQIISKETIQKHAILLEQNLNERIVFGLLGRIDRYKGYDIFVDVWEKYSTHKNVFLIVVGRTEPPYQLEFKKYAEKLKNYSNVYFFNERFTEEEEKMFYSLIDVLVLPYKTASMSGVLFSAAQYEKSVLSSNVGCLEEYLAKCNDMAYICEPNEADISYKMEKIIQDNTKESLKDRGKQLSSMIYERFSWESIMRDIKENCYISEL